MQIKTAHCQSAEGLEAPPRNTSLAVKYSGILENFKHVPTHIPWIFFFSKISCKVPVWDGTRGGKVIRGSCKIQINFEAVLTSNFVLFPFLPKFKGPQQVPLWYSKQCTIQHYNGSPIAESWEPLAQTFHINRPLVCRSTVYTLYNSAQILQTL